MTKLASFSGFGLGLRKEHYTDFLSREVPVAFVEIISENFMVSGGRALHTLDAVRERHPVAMHGVSMSIGTAQGVNRDYLTHLKTLANRVQPLWVSDHLCWTNVGGFNSHDLLPLPYTEEALDIVCANIGVAQDILERPLLFENPSSYVSFADADMTEWEFLAAMAERTGCYLLLDVNNIYVSGTNHGFDPDEFLAGIPVDRVRQMHLAGHSVGADMLIDTHDAPVCDDVWALYTRACDRFGHAATMIERDDDIPALDVLLVELDTARARASDLCAA
ncbi:MAG: DUF692 domain-containing protein [Sphingomonadaceae bacterium]